MRGLSVFLDKNCEQKIYVKLTESLTYAPYIIVRGRTEKAIFKNLEIPEVKRLLNDVLVNIRHSVKS
jgi:hypothetical protein